MVLRTLVKKGGYYDSVLLLKISQKAAEYEGTREAAVVMATKPNIKILQDLGLYDESLKNTASDDLVIAIDADEDRVDDYIEKIQKDITGERRMIEKEYFPKSIESALERLPEANIVAISIPGEYARREALYAIKRGLNTFIFSSNIPLEEEKELKEKGNEKGLLVMGPDCGTVIFNGIVLGFGNVLEKGNVGIVAAAGTGIQGVSCLLDKMGVGISHAIGTGGNDLSEEIGGITMMNGIDFLEKDQTTEVIVIISKPPAQVVEDKILRYLQSHVKKPVIANFIGGDPKRVKDAGFNPAYTLDEAAVKAAQMVKGEEIKDTYIWNFQSLRKLAEREWAKMHDEQRYIRGLYSGGTLCYEAQLILRDFIGDSYSNSPLKPDLKLSDSFESVKHTLVDLGGEEFVAGRLHPMIDPTIRKRRLKKEGEDPSTSVILLDIVLGYGCHLDPAGALLDEIKNAKINAEKQGRHLPIVSTVIGTEHDPQVLSLQEKKLREAGVVVLTSNAQAAIVAGFISTRGKPRVALKDPW